MNRKICAALLATAALPGVARAQATASEFTSATRYDAMRRVTGTIAPDPDGTGPLRHAATRNTYDPAGRLTRVEVGELAAWQLEDVRPANWTEFEVLRQVDIQYDAIGRKLVERSSSKGTPYAVTQYSYDALGRLDCTALRMNPAAFASPPASACTQPVPQQGVEPDRITRNLYDVAGQLVQVRKAVGTPLEQAYVTYGYTPNGKQEYVVDANGNKARQTWDGFDRQAQWQFPSTTAPTGFGGSTPASALATAGAVSSTDYEAYGYDDNGNRTSWRKRDGRVFAFGYDALDRLTSKVVPDDCAPIQRGACPAAAATRDVYYSYDLRGLQTAARFDSASGTDAVTSGYDGFGRLTSSTTAMDGMSRALAFGYDANGNRTRVQHPDGAAFVHAYDGLDRLGAITLEGSGQVAALTYDREGRRAALSRGGVTTTYGYVSSDKAGRLHDLTDNLAGTAGDVVSTFGYNPAGQITRRARDNESYAYAGAFNKSLAYTANGLNQYTAIGGATQAHDASGNLVADGGTTYGYDAENRLVSASTGAALAYDPAGRLWQVSGGAAGATRFLYDGDQLSAEYDASGNLLRRYVHGAGEDDPLLWYEGAELSDRRSLQTDHQGSVVSIADAAGNATTINAYDEYGAPGRNNVGRFQYTGQAWLPELKLYHYKARAYSPRSGRFLQTDPVGYDDQVNLYAYVANDPVNGRDPTGMACKTVGTATVCAEAPTGSLIPRTVSVTFRTGNTAVSAGASSNGVSVAARAGDASVSASAGREGAAIGARAGDASVSASAGPDGAAVGARAGGSSVELRAGTIQPDRVPRGYAVDRSLEAKVGRPDQVGLRPSPTTGTQRAVEGFRRVLDALSKIFE